MAMSARPMQRLRYIVKAPGGGKAAGCSAAWVFAVNSCCGK